MAWKRWQTQFELCFSPIPKRSPIDPLTCVQILSALEVQGLHLVDWTLDSNRTLMQEKDARLHPREGMSYPVDVSSGPASLCFLTYGKGHESSILLQLSPVVQEVLGVEIFGVREELWVCQQRT